VDPAAARQVAAARRRGGNAQEDGGEGEQLQAAEAAGAAVSGLMRFTGSALTGLASFAANLSDQMERSAAQAAAEAAAQKQVRRREGCPAGGCSSCRWLLPTAVSQPSNPP
jgi:hypothetical protein